jgi:hypothetical protein
VNSVALRDRDVHWEGARPAKVGVAGSTPFALEKTATKRRRSSITEHRERKRSEFARKSRNAAAVLRP